MRWEREVAGKGLKKGLGVKKKVEQITKEEEMRGSKVKCGGK